MRSGPTSLWSCQRPESLLGGDWSDAALRDAWAPGVSYRPWAVSEPSAALKSFYDGRSRNQAGDPARLGQALVALANAANPPVRWAAGSDALRLVQGKIDSLQAELMAWRELSASTDGDFEFREEVATGAWA
ncbi:hypothetical protein [Brevundimonas lutea]|uniref:hypothetical protein n=1 Tax=Brevundimonas lutea TaxID=2293980 RepID=UPI00196AB8DE|nr:hypothetical protein [Brevundimonas lutea]